MKTTAYTSAPAVDTVRAWVQQMDPGIELVFVRTERELRDNLATDRSKLASLDRLVLREDRLEETTWDCLAGLLQLGRREGCLLLPGFGYRIKSAETKKQIEDICRAAVAQLASARQSAEFQQRETGRTKAMEKQPFWAAIKRRHRRW